MAEAKRDQGRVRVRVRAGLSSDHGYTTKKRRPLRSMEDVSWRATGEWLRPSRHG
jgi:hypothetical protein